MTRPGGARPRRQEGGQGLPGAGERRGGGTAKGDKASFWGDQDVLKLTMVMNIQLHEYTESHRIVQFKCVNCMARELHLEKTILKKVSDRSSGRLQSEQGPQVRAAAVAAAVQGASQTGQGLGRQAHRPPR